MVNILLLVLFTWWDQTAIAQERAVLDPVTVMVDDPRDRISTSLPYSVNHFKALELKKRNVTRIQDIISDTANTSLMDSGMSAYLDVIGVRGLVNTQFFSAPSMVVYVDDIPYGSTSTYINRLYAVDSIEVYRGPQFSRFGVNGYGGAINVKTHKPNNQWGGNMSIEIARFDRVSINGEMSGPAIENKLYYTVGGAYLRRDGYLDNTFQNSDADEIEQFSGRASLNWDISKHWGATFTAGIEDFDNGASRIVSLDNNRFFKIQSDADDKLEQRSNNQALKVRYHGNDIEFLSVTARRDWRLDPWFTDIDLSPQPLATRLIKEDEEQWSQEFRIQSTNTNTPWNWHTGLYLARNESTALLETFILGVSELTRLREGTTDNYALFGAIGYQASDSLHLAIELRLDYVETFADRVIMTAFPTGPTFENKARQDFFFVSPKLGLDYQFNDNLLVYMSSGLTFKPGGFSVTGTTLFDYQKETLWANELGLKAYWLDRHIGTNLTVFYYDIKNYQIERLFNTLDYAVVNADKVRSYGFELELEARAFDMLSVEATVGHTNIEFKDYMDPISGNVFDGNNAPFVPDFNAVVAAEYQHPAGYFARGEWIWTGDTYFDEANSRIAHEDDYSTANLRIGYQNHLFSLHAFINNLFDTRYFTFRYPATRHGVPGAPKSYGIRFEATF